MRIGILGTGTLAAALGAGWARAGHDLVIGGRSMGKARALAGGLGGSARAATPREAVAGRDAVLLAVLWSGVEEILRRADAASGTLEGTPLIDPTNAVEHGVGKILVDSGGSAAQRVAELAPGSHVVKAFHLFPADRWGTPADDPWRPIVAMCGDDPKALDVIGQLVRDVGGTPTVLGGLDRGRQLEEVAGFVIGLAFSGVDPGSAVPRVSAAS